jgi:serine/threonine protein kinase
MRAARGVELADGRYRLERRLGAGGMAAVWLARDTRLDRLVAVKVIADTLADDEGWLLRFRREAQAAAALSHPNIVQVFDYGLDDGRPFLVMEHVEGANLAQRLADPAAPAPDARRLARELLEALAHVHAAGIVHRDIKPANILLDARDRVHVTDFGIAHSEGLSPLTQTGVVIGTMKYLAPEVAGGERPTGATDLYAAGMVIGEVAGPDPRPDLGTLIEALVEPHPLMRLDSAQSALELMAATDETDPDPTARVPQRPTEPAQLPAATREAAARRAERCATQPRAEQRADARRPRRRVSRAAISAVAVALIALVVVLSETAGTDSGHAETPASAAPASPGAPLDEQLRALDRIVDRAAAR